MNERPNLWAMSGELECPSCGSRDVQTTMEEDSFEYGEKEAVKLSVVVPVHSCHTCSMTYTDEAASELRHEAICGHLGVMTPKEVLAVRERYSLSQSEFSEITKIGKASLARWENAQLIQNSANDNLLYLLTFEENLTRLKDRASRRTECRGGVDSCAKVIPFVPRFRAIAAADIERRKADASRFELYPVLKAQ